MIETQTLAAVSHSQCLLLLEVVQRLASARDLAEVQAVVRQAARSLSGADGVTFVVREGAEVFYADEDAITPLWKGKRFPTEACISGWSMVHRQQVVIEDIYQDSRIPHDAYRPTFVKSLVMTPIRREDPIAAIGAYWATAHCASEHELSLLQSLADATAVAMMNVELMRSLQVSRDEAAAKEAHFHELFDFMPQLGWTARPDGYIDYYNRGWYEYTGKTPEQLLGWGWQSVHDPEMVAAATERWQHTLKTGEPFEMAFRLRRHDGAYRWFLTRVRALRDPDGKILRWVGINTDIDEQKRVEVERVELLQRAQSAARAKDEFLAMLGHELRNPLAPITTALHLLRLRGSDAGSRELDVIDRQVKHLVQLVDDLLDISRITRGKVALKKERIEMAEVVAKAIEMASPLIEQRRHHLTLSVPRQGLAVDADPARLAQVIAQLLTNAAKYTEPEGSISIVSERSGTEVILRVRDTGIGISPELLPRVFELFVQERQSLERSQGGLGLGLAIVRNLMHSHGGQAEAHSAGIGRGSEFVLRLPRLDLSAATHVSALPISGDVRSESGPGSSNPTAANQRKVLVVDDHTDIADLLAEALRVNGYAVQVAYDGPQALKLVEHFVPELALLDIGLPSMDGYELAKRLRERPGLHKLRLAAITGYGQEADRLRAAQAGFDAHLVKPVELPRLMHLIDQLMSPRLSVAS